MKQHHSAVVCIFSTLFCSCRLISAETVTNTRRLGMPYDGRPGAPTYLPRPQNLDSPGVTTAMWMVGTRRGWRNVGVDVCVPM